MRKIGLSILHNMCLIAAGCAALALAAMVFLGTIWQLPIFAFWLFVMFKTRYWYVIDFGDWADVYDIRELQ